MIRALKSLATFVGTITIFGILVITGLCIYDSVTKKPIGGTSTEDEDDCPYYIDPDFEDE